MGNTCVKKTLNILCLEDEAGDRELMEQTLAAEGLDCRVVQVQARKEFEAMLQQKQFDLIISDFSLPAYDGGAALAAARKNQPETPFILLSGTIGEERAVEFLKSGATDCVLKQNLNRLGPAIRRALAEAEERRRRKKAEDSLHAQARQLRALAARLQASREEERIRIARELHDELGEALTAQKFGLSLIRQRLNGRDQPFPRDEIFAKLESLAALADGTAQRVRRLCTELRPAILDDLGLLAAIEWQAQEFQTRTGIECNLIRKIDLLNVNSRQATAVFRIFQEILTNVARHARASSVQVKLKTAEENLVLQVKDDGAGISEDKINGGVSLGILGMRERAALLGGELAIQGVPAKGTTVTLSLPLNFSQPADDEPETSGL